MISVSIILTLTISDQVMTNAQRTESVRLFTDYNDADFDEPVKYEIKT